MVKLKIFVDISFSTVTYILHSTINNLCVISLPSPHNDIGITALVFIYVSWTYATNNTEQ